MLATAALTLLLAQQHMQPTAQPEAPRPSALVGKMLARYFEAPTIVGRIGLTVAAPTGAVNVETTLQIERPGKMYIRQTKSAGDKRAFLITADGKGFTYDAPDIRIGQPSNKRLFEAYGKKTEIYDLKAAFSVAGAVLPDRSMALDVAIGRREDLAFIRGQWATMQAMGSFPVREQTAFVVGGDWRPDATAPVAGTYRMAITADGDLVQYEIRQTIVVPGSNLGPQTIVQTWDVNLSLTTKPNPDLFKLVM